MDVRCEYKGEKVDCNKHVPIGTEATARCKVGYMPTEKAANSTTVCNEYGQWSQNFINCVPPVCGMKNPYEPGFPWSVIIYQDHSYECFGTLISPNVVLTNARCVYEVMPTERFGVIMGNVYRSSSREQLKDKEIHVSNVSVHPQYIGRDRSYEFNIALLKLKTRVLHTPACIDWNSDFHLIPGQLGTSGTYGSVTICDVPYKLMDYGSCLSELVDDHRHYLTPDKFCARYIEGTPDVGDRGSGFLFERNGIYFVKGVTHHDWFRSHDCGSCIALFMNLSDPGLLNWLTQTMVSFDHDDY